MLCGAVHILCNQRTCLHEELQFLRRIVDQRIVPSSQSSATTPNIRPARQSVIDNRPLREHERREHDTRLRYRTLALCGACSIAPLRHLEAQALNSPASPLPRTHLGCACLISALRSLEVGRLQVWRLGSCGPRWVKKGTLELQKQEVANELRIVVLRSSMYHNV